MAERNVPVLFWLQATKTASLWMAERKLLRRNRDRTNGRFDDRINDSSDNDATMFKLQFGVQFSLWIRLRR